MADKYVPGEIEARWAGRWERDGLYRSRIDPSRPKFYALTMLPYPSGDLHIGHWYAMAPSDARARWLRMRGYNVLFPMGFDAFGLNAENAAIKRNIHPKTWTERNMANMRRQLRTMGAIFDWEREAVTSHPRYYRWTQWFFLQFFKAGLAYRKNAAVDFCPQCNTTLAREQVWGEDRHCERCGTPVIKKELEQWFFRTTDYAEELLDHSLIDWPERVKTMQANWIGRSEGAHVTFRTEGGDPIEVFTTRPDTLWGATFMVLAPEHPLVNRVTTPQQRPAVEAYVAAAARKSEIDRTAEGKDKTGVFTGGYAVNPVNSERIPIWIADYVLISYGSGAIMAVPAHDQRDFEFARKFSLPIRIVIQPEGASDLDPDKMTEAWPGEGVMVNSAQFDGTPATASHDGAKNEAVRVVTRWLEEQGIGRAAINYRLRDWLISRQRYWGAPIPIVYCPACGTVPVPESELPILLPDDVDFMPTGESPLRYHEGFLHTTCPQCGGPATRETDTMDTFMCSSWYQYRYLSPLYDGGPFDPAEGAYWLPVDQYTGGIEHATMHLMYTRFFTKAMRDCGIFQPTAEAAKAIGRDTSGMFDEPMLRLFNQGMILGEPREGDLVIAQGAFAGGKFDATSVRVVESLDGVPVTETQVAGEVLNRVETTLHVRTPDGQDSHSGHRQRHDLRHPRLRRGRDDQPDQAPPGRGEDVQDAGQRHRARRAGRRVRRGHGARLPDVRFPLGSGRPLGQQGHLRRGALAARRMDRGQRGCVAGHARPRRRARSAPQSAPDDQESLRRAGGLQLQHGHGRADGAEEQPAKGRPRRQGEPGGVGRGRRDHAAADGPLHTVRRRRAVGARRGAVQHPQPGVARLRRGAGRRRGDHAGGAGQRQGARPHPGARRHRRGRGQAPGAGVRRGEAAHGRQARAQSDLHRRAGHGEHRGVVALERLLCYHESDRIQGRSSYLRTASNELQ
ncbi:MAG: leucine--tRNA ligase [Anaerolineae bacterium]|nr:leucine--tRNA ligase [Anaerolineae bacterium]